MRLSGKVAIVTGAGRGIGRAIARRLASEGAILGINDINVDTAEAVTKELRERGTKAIAVPCDVSDRAAVGAMTAKVVAEFGRLDVMIANAGIVTIRRILDISPEDLEGHLRVNVHGVLNCIQAGAQAMIDGKHGGKIIAASSIAGRQGWAFMGHYSATKFAVVGLVQAAAKEFGSLGITVNAYCPGMVKGDMAEIIDAGVGGYLGMPKGAAVEHFSKMITLGRMEEPEDVACLVSFLASGDADYVTGQTIAIDGGVTF